MEVSFALQATGDAPTRAEGEDPAIGNIRALYADRVRVNVYRRPAGPTYADDFEDFTFDQSVGLTLNEVPADVTDIALLCGTMHTTSGAAFYSDFLAPADPLTATEAERAGRFELMSWTRPAGATGEVTATLTGANLLPVTGRLTVRFTQGGTPRITTLRLHEGTTPDADLARGIVTFRRNHYYQVTGHFDKMATQGLTLSLTVNPHWSGDADLGLGGK